MSHPQPDDGILREWQAISETLLENLPVDAAVIRRVGGGSLEVLAAAPESDRYTPGERAPQDGSHFCDHLLADGKVLEVNGAQGGNWDHLVERKAGFNAYFGTVLSWPDSEPYGTLAVLSRETLSSDDAARTLRLLQRMAVSATALLSGLVKREQGHYEATHDALTGLPNRQLFHDLANMQMKAAQRSSAALWVVLWSVDGFRELAEERGRESVNVMLGRVTERARSCIRQSDVLARLGDNQFAFMLAGANEFVANAVAERLRRNLSTLSPWPDDSATRVTTSCGLSPYHDKEPLDTWLGRARMAMDDASQAGGDVAMVREA